MTFSKRLLQIPRWVFLVSLIFFAISYFQKNELPDPKDINPKLLLTPTQTQTKKKPFHQKFDKETYSISPQYDYELYGLVVTSRDLDKTWYNVNYERDPFNIIDICVIWGGNVTTGDYKKIDFESGLFTCYVSYREHIIFIPNALSNNHLLPGNIDSLRAMRDVHRGDQIHFKGQLINYTTSKGGNRVSSVSRDDMGKHACEVVYVELFEILKKGNPFWYALYRTTKYLLVLSGLGWVYITLFVLPPSWKN